MCAPSYASRGRDSFHLGKATSERSDANMEEVRSAEVPQQQFDATLAAAAREHLDYSMVLSVPYDF